MAIIEANIKNVKKGERPTLTRRLEDFEKMINSLRSFSPFILKSLHTHFNPSQNVFPLLLLNGLVMVKNEGLIACKCLK